MSRKQRANLPCLHNPLLYKVVFDAYRIPRHIRAPQLTFTHHTPKNKSNNNNNNTECILTVTESKTQRLLVKVVVNESSKKKATAKAYQTLCLHHVPYDSLVEAMKPYSISQGVAEGIGEHVYKYTTTAVCIYVYSILHVLYVVTQRCVLCCSAIIRESLTNQKKTYGICLLYRIAFERKEQVYSAVPSSIELR